MILTLALLALPQAAPGTCVLVEGVGSDFAKINVALQDRKGTLPKKIALEYDGDVLVRIIVSEGDCRTSKGIKLGDSESEVHKLYGNAKKAKPYLMKGASSPVGKPGDWIDEYAGVAFLISGGKVAAFFIQTAPPEKVSSQSAISSTPQSTSVDASLSCTEGVIAKKVEDTPARLKYWAMSSVCTSPAQGHALNDLSLV